MGDQIKVTGKPAVMDGVWAHLAITYDRGKNEALTYVNGVAQASPKDISVVGDGELDWSSGDLSVLFARMSRDTWAG